MPRRQGPGLSLAEWLVLGLVSEEPTHGFALAAILAPGGSLGVVWSVPKAVVYRAVQRLERLGLITAEDRQYSRQGPPRARLHVTPEGRRAVQGWLRQPAGHHRDVRSELLLKLALLSRLGADPRDLLLAQRRELLPAAARLSGQLRTATGFDQALTRWRHESVGGTLRFIDTLLAAAPAPRGETRSGGSGRRGDEVQDARRRQVLLVDPHAER